jgi:hypothetical protein
MTFASSLSRSDLMPSRNALLVSSLVLAATFAAPGSAWAGAPPTLPEPNASGTVAPASTEAESPAATTTAASTVAPATTSAANAPSGPNIDAVHGSVGYRTQPNATQIAVYEGGAHIHTVAASCAISAMTVHEGFLYVGCANGQLHLYALDAEGARAPVHSGSYDYPNPIIGFRFHEGQFVVDAPAPSAPQAPPPALAPGLGPVAAQAPGPARDRDAELKEAMQTRREKRRLNLGRDLMIGGFTGFGVAYGVSALMGMTNLGFRDGAGWYFVPLVGPFVSAPNSLTPGWDVIVGVSQVGTLVLGSVGASIYSREKNKRLTVGHLGVPRGGGVQFRYRF